MSLQVGPAGEKLVGIVPRLKGIERATTKVHEKYSGKFDQLTDLARMTFECPTVAIALAVLRFIHRHSVRNMPTFDGCYYCSSYVLSYWVLNLLL